MKGDWHIAAVVVATLVVLAVVGWSVWLIINNWADAQLRGRNYDE